MKKVFLSFSILLFISVCPWAQNIPQTIDYQGRLTDSAGNYLTGVYSVEFDLFNLETGGSELWIENHDVSINNGIFHVLLGTLNPFPAGLFDNSDLWLEFHVGAEILLPRTRIASVPYSIKAESAYTVEAPLNLSGNVSDPNSVIKGENTGSGSGVYGKNTSFGNYGYLGSLDCGVFGRNYASSGYGVYGQNWADSGIGVYGSNSSLNGYGVYGRNEAYGGHGVYGSYYSGNHGYLGSLDYGAYGKHTSSGNYGYLGSSDYAVYGYNTELTGSGIYGYSTGLYAGYFNSDRNSGSTHVVHAEFTGTNYDAKAVYGKSTPAVGYGYGGVFDGGYMGVRGTVDATNGTSIQEFIGVRASVSGGLGTNSAIYCTANGSNVNYGLRAGATGGTYNLAGYFLGDVLYTGTLNGVSDKRFKENVQPFSNALSKIKLMNVHTFNYIQIEEEKQLVLPEGEQIGLIAQELEEILPELVSDNVHTYNRNENIEDAERDMDKIEYKGINYIGLIPVLIEAIKEQQEMIKAQQTQNEEQQRQIDELLRSTGN